MEEAWIRRLGLFYNFVVAHAGLASSLPHSNHQVAHCSQLLFVKDLRVSVLKFAKNLGSVRCIMFIPSHPCPLEEPGTEATSPDLYRGVRGVHKEDLVPRQDAEP